MEPHRPPAAASSDSQDEHCEVSQPLFSEESLKISDEAKLITNLPNIIVMPSDSDSIPVKIEDETAKKRTSEEQIGSETKICIIESSEASTTDISNGENLMKKSLNKNPKFIPSIFKCDITPVKALARRSPRNHPKRRNSFSCNAECEKPMRRLKRSLSADIECQQKEIHIGNDGAKAYRTNQTGLLEDYPMRKTMKKSCSTIFEELPSQIYNPSQHIPTDSQNIVIEFSPTQSNYTKESSIKTSSESLSHNVILPTSIDEHLDSTLSINIESPCESISQSVATLKNKPANGCSSSTPKFVGYDHAAHFKVKNSHSSGIDSDATPPPNEFQKSTAGSKSNSASGASNVSMPISNGHSDTSHIDSIGSHPLNPMLDVQICCDENNEFVSFVIVKTDNELGLDLSKEIQKVLKRAGSDQYIADISKSNSPSSVTSGGLLQLPSRSRTSLVSSTSSSSSVRTHDGVFTIPQRRDRSFLNQSCVTIKSLSALKTKFDSVFSHLMEMYGYDDHSLSHLYDKASANNTLENNSKRTLSNGKSDTDIALNNHALTPKSSKKKLQTKTKRNGNFKAKKTLSSMTEEVHMNGEIHSPEMIASNPSKCQRPHTPILSENNNSPKSFPKMRTKKEADPMSPKSKCSVVKADSVSHCPGTLVLAKWIDKKYYSGIIKKNLDGNKYLVDFYDGQQKTLLEDFIIFGNTKELPILGESIHAIIDDQQQYEPSLVLSLIEDEKGTILYQCTTDRDVTKSVKVSDIYVTEDQAKSIREACSIKSPRSLPNTPRRRVNRELDLDNIIHGPRSARLKNRDSANTPHSPEASTSGLAQKRRSRKNIPPKQRQESESSEGGEATPIRAPSSIALEEVMGVQPEIQKTPRKIEGVKIADALLIKGISKQNPGKRCSKVTKFENDSDTNSRLGPIPAEGSVLFKDLHFILTCTDIPQPTSHCDNHRQDSSVSDSEREDRTFSSTPFQKDRIKEQLEAGGGIVYSHFEDIPKDKYSICKLIAPRPCLTAKYIQCLAANIKALSHFWVVRSCLSEKQINMGEDALPAGWSIEKKTFINWEVSPEHRISVTPFKDSLILLCSDSDKFIEFWRRVCNLAGGKTRTITDDVDVSDGLVIVTESDCPHEIQNKAIHYNIPLVSTNWVIQCLIEGKICDHRASVEYDFAFTGDGY